MKKWRVPGVALLATSLLFASCGNPFSALFKSRTSTGSVTINFSAPVVTSSTSSSRTILPGIVANASVYVVTLTSSGCPTKTQTVDPLSSLDQPTQPTQPTSFKARGTMSTGSSFSCNFPAVEVGRTWTVTVTAQAGSQTIGQGNGTVTVASGGSASMLIGVYPTAPLTGGFGNIAIPISISETSAPGWTADFVLYPYGSTTAHATLNAVPLVANTTNNDEEGSYSCSNVPSGEYTLAVTFHQGTVIAGSFSEAVDVWPGLTSAAWVNASGVWSPAWQFLTSQLLDTDASLSLLTIMDQNNTQLVSLPSFVTNYNLGSLATTTSVSFAASPSATEPDAMTYVWNGGASTSVPADGQSPALRLRAGQNSLVLTVTAPDAKTTQTYTVTMQLPAAVSTSPTNIAMVPVNGGSFTFADGSQLRSGLVGEWLLGGTLSDSSGSSNDGTSANAGFSGTSDRFGNPAGAVFLPSGTGPNVVMPVSSEYEFSYTSTFSVSLWFNMSNMPGGGGWPALLSLTDSGGEFDYGLFVTNGWDQTSPPAPTPTVEVEAGKNAVGDTSINAAFALGQWNHVVYVYNAGTMSLYLNGVLVGSNICSSDYSGATTPSAGYLSLGGGQTGAFQGSLSDIRIYNCTLAPAEVIELYNGDTSTVSSFLMGKYEVTQQQWQAVASTTYPTGMTTGSNLPITNITWYDMAGFCNRLSTMEGLDPVYTIKNSDSMTWDGTFPNTSFNVINADFSKNGYRLPTSMEWRWAMMGGTKDEEYTGGGVDAKGYTKQFAGDNGVNTANLDAYAWNYNSNYYPPSLQPVGQKLPNELDMYDLSGNAGEWCWDDSATPSGSVTDYRGGGATDSITPHSIRGGNYSETQPTYGGTDFFGQVSEWMAPNATSPSVGFRVVRNYPGSSPTTGTAVVISDPGVTLAISGSSSIYGSGSAAYMAVGNTTFDQYNWYLNGVQLTQTWNTTNATMDSFASPNTSPSIVLNPSMIPDFYVGPNRLTVVVEKGSTWYSEEMTVTYTGGSAS